MSIQEKQALTEKQLSILGSEMEKHKKSTGLAYALWFFFGTLGIHKFYIGKAKWGALYLVLGIIGWATVFTGGIAALANDSSSAGSLGIIAILCLGFVGICLLIDLFTMPKQLKKSYEIAEQKVIINLNA